MRALILFLMLVAALFAGLRWLADHPQHDPRAPLSLDHPIGWATRDKVAALADSPAQCAAVLGAGGVGFTRLPPVGADACRVSDRVVLSGEAADRAALRPADAAATCPVQVALILWQRTSVQPAATELLGSPVVRIDHLGTANCRRIGGSGEWSEHASGNAIDIAGFTLADGRRISVLDDWDDAGPRGTFLRRARDGACDLFATTLSPDYNAAHADHFHLDQADRAARWTACR